MYLPIRLEIPARAAVASPRSLRPDGVDQLFDESIVFGFVFYGYGFGLFGRLGSAAVACIGLVFYIAQVHASRIWLTRFRFGPFEWLWRSLAYGRRQPFLRNRAISVHTSPAEVDS